jgi:hypothetical protein
MKLSSRAVVGPLIVSAGLIAATTGLAAPAQADASADAFVNALSNAGLGPSDPARAVELGQTVCPMLADSGQTTTNVAAKVADAGGMSLGPATMFTGIAISMFCPSTIARLGSDLPPILALPGVSF